MTRSPLRPARVRATFVGLALFVAFPAATRAQEMDVPVPLQAALITRVMAFDRNAPPAGPVKLAIVYQQGNRASVDAARALERALTDARVGDRRIEVVRVDLDRRSLAEALGAEKPFAAWVAPMRALEVAHIVKCLRDARVRSFSGVVSYVRDGIAVGVRADGDRPKLLVNLTASRAEGAEYQSSLLHLAEVIP